MDIKDYYIALEEIFELDENTLTGEESLSDNDLVDSLSLLGLISFLDKKCGIQMGPADILNAGTVNDLYKIIDKHQK